MSPFVRNLTFQSNNLGKEVTIMLAWSSNLDGLYQDVFPIVWKVIKFGKEGPYKATATYTAQFAFSRAQFEAGKVISAATSVSINHGEKTTLTEANEVYHFSPPQAGTYGTMQAQNCTGTPQGMAIGFVNKGDFMPTPALYFSDVGNNSRVTVKFTPTLRAYVTSDYEETAVLRSQVDTPAIWSQDLTGLAQNTTWNISRDANTGRYTITHA
ncbi:uncharacterized protein EDB93DRAFT_1184528 [Suillus bovinus]|uniref:uncharacterized protein n=1 Tax=Suillus bovinus TaxID=48563 RepID=UPI001B867C0E|nr:uncharacterized protein EDB93DRAFT_1184528 [Suillus bovinus]KAG2128527.1 hypothetical protein EDB93DRAFT_1184528 [Suillus bovinus]